MWTSLTLSILIQPICPTLKNFLSWECPKIWQWIFACDPSKHPLFWWHLFMILKKSSNILRSLQILLQMLQNLYFKMNSKWSKNEKWYIPYRKNCFCVNKFGSSGIFPENLNQIGQIISDYTSYCFIVRIISQ